MEDAAILAAVAVRLGQDRHLPIGAASLRCDGGVLTFEGEVPSLGTKRRLLARAASAPGLLGIVDRLRVRPARRLGDGEIIRRLGQALLAEKALREYTIRVGWEGRLPVAVRVSQADRDEISALVRTGVVLLAGSVRRHFDKCVAGALAWSNQGTREVVNRISVRQMDEGLDDAIATAIRHGLSNELATEAARLRVKVRRGVVWLSGSCGGGDRCHLAEEIAWRVFGVERVINRIG